MPEHHCTFCKETGHNIRTCKDPRILSCIRHLIFKYIACRIPLFDFHISQSDYSSIFEYLFELPKILVEAISIQYCGAKRYTSIAEKLRSVLMKLVEESMYLSNLDSNGKDQWYIEVTGMPLTQWINMNTFNDDDEYIATYPAYQISLAEPATHCDECAICQEKKSEADFVIVQCKHAFCHTCMGSYLSSKDKNRATCPLCRVDIEELVTADNQVFENLELYYSETGAILKTCSLMAFGDPGFHRKSFEYTIDMFLYEYEYDKDFQSGVKSLQTPLEKARHIFSFIQKRS